MSTPEEGGNPETTDRGGGWQALVLVTVLAVRLGDLLAVVPAAIGRRVGQGLEALFTVLGGLATPVFAAVDNPTTRRVGRRIRAAVGATVTETRTTTRQYAAGLPQVPAPTLSLPRVGEVPTRYLAGGLALLLLVAVPLGLTAFQLSALILPVYLMVFAMSWDAVSGYTGQLSFGHTFFFALGGYTSTILNLQHGVTPVVSIPLGVVVAAIGGLVIGFPALRVRGPYLSLITLIAPLILLQIVILFNSNLPYVAPSGLGGVNGFVATNDPLVGTTGAAVLTVPSFPWVVIVDYYLAVALFVLSAALMLLVTRSGTGEILTAIRENEDVVEAVGLDTAKFKLFAFVLSGAVGGLAGAMFVHSSIGNPLNPQQILSITVAINIVIMAILGGMGTIVGAAVGAVFFVAVTFLVGQFGGGVVVPILGESLASLMPAPLFLAALLVVIYRPEGLVPALVNFGRWLNTPPEEREVPDDPGGKSTLERVLEQYRDTLDR